MFRKTFVVLLTLVAIPAYSSDLLEPCINGDVSASGNFPSQETEDQMLDYLSWQSADPDYLFRVASQEITSPYPEN